jgi:acetyl-CoA C-acetyltransferase
MAQSTVILGYARTPFGKLMGGLSSLAATELGGHAIAAALERSGVAPSDVDHVIMGNVLQAGGGQIPSRQAAVAGGVAMDVSSETINKVCASGHRAVTLSDLLIRAGEHDVVVSGGMESMSRAPHLLTDLRSGRKMGDDPLLDSMISDGLTDPFLHVHMVVNGANVADELGLSRERQDQWALRSHQRAAAAAANLQEEIVPVTISSRRGDTVVDADESVRPDTTIEALAQLKPIMKADGTATAGNSPGVNDGAAALVLANDSWAQARGLQSLARVRAYAYVAGESPYLAVHPGQAVQRLLEREGLSIDDIARIEVNEAFASVAVNTVDMLGADPDRVNVNGGAVALGHPIGASGARIIGSLVLELRRSGGGLGIACICSGGGQGDAVLVEVDAA